MICFSPPSCYYRCATNDGCDCKAFTTWTTSLSTFQKGGSYARFFFLPLVLLLMLFCTVSDATKDVAFSHHNSLISTAYVATRRHTSDKKYMQKIDSTSSKASTLINNNLPRKRRKNNNKTATITSSSTSTSTTTALYEIPPEFRSEIYKAEAKTEAAQGRKTRLTVYFLLAAIGFICGSANAALTTLILGGGDVREMGYGWTQNVPLLSTKWGGWFDLILTGVFGTLADLEIRTKDETAEKIWLEFERRRNAPSPKSRSPGSSKVSTAAQSSSKGGKRASKRQKKRMAALAEVVGVVESDDYSKEENKMKGEKEKAEEETVAAAKGDVDGGGGGGILGSMKQFYKQADAMAASQALLLNKNLEDRGLIEKITDESGLKVVGKKKEMKKKKGEEEIGDDVASSKDEIQRKGEKMMNEDQ